MTRQELEQKFKETCDRIPDLWFDTFAEEIAEDLREVENFYCAPRNAITVSPVEFHCTGNIRWENNVPREQYPTRNG